MRFAEIATILRDALLRKSPRDGTNLLKKLGPTSQLVLGYM
jgi:hypothetical protein